MMLSVLVNDITVRGKDVVSGRVCIIERYLADN